MQRYLFFRVNGLRGAILEDTVLSEERVNAIFAAGSKRNSQTVVSSLHAELNNLLSSKQSSNKSSQNVETGFAAQLSRFNALSSQTAIRGAPAALMLIEYANVDTFHRVSILAAAASSRSNGASNASTDELLHQVQFERAGTVLRQCIEQNVFQNNNAAVYSSSATFLHMYKIVVVVVARCNSTVVVQKSYKSSKTCIHACNVEYVDTDTAITTTLGSF